jgi:hypothetical protein
MLQTRQQTPTVTGIARAGAWLARFRQPAEPVELCALRYRYFPWRFRSRGCVRQVYRIERVWETPATPRRHGRRLFQVRIDDGSVVVLFQDLHIGTWHRHG